MIWYRYIALSEEKKIKKEYGRNSYWNMSAGDKQKLKEYEKNCLKNKNKN